MASKTCLLLKIQILDAKMDHEMNSFLITSIDALIFAKASAFLHNLKLHEGHADMFVWGLLCLYAVSSALG